MYSICSNDWKIWGILLNFTFSITVYTLIKANDQLLQLHFYDIFIFFSNLQLLRKIMLRKMLTQQEKCSRYQRKRKKIACLHLDKWWPPKTRTIMNKLKVPYQVLYVHPWKCIIQYKVCYLKFCFFPETTRPSLLCFGEIVNFNKSLLS